jgi:hypothetical protein
MVLNLAELAQIKIKLDILEKQYKEKLDAIRAEMLAKNDKQVKDSEHGLMLELTDSSFREFNPTGVREVLGEIKANQCIESKVSAKSFDAITKKGGKCILSEEEQARCYIMVPKTALNWDGLDVYKSRLMDKIKSA